MPEVRALRLAGLPNAAILRMATTGSAAALGIGERAGTIEAGRPTASWSGATHWSTSRRWAR
jgi:cytosine/adenosine deaminase-related metal-dependent hydrolase